MEQFTFIDFFAGIGGFRRGMELAGHRCVGFCEWDKFATASYTSMHLITPEQKDYLSTLSLRQRQKEILQEEYRNGEWYASDIRTVTGTDVPKADCWCFGAPCFVAGTLITTHRGLVPIEEIQAGDLVLTHKNRFQKVITPMINVKKGIYTLKVQGSPKTEVTGNHRFFVRDKTRKWNSEIRRYDTIISDPYWKEVQNFNGNELLQFTVNHEENNMYGLTVEECWLIGRYIADGYIRNDERKDRPSKNQRVVFCIGKHKKEVFESHCQEILMYPSEERTSIKYMTGNKKLFALCLQCGRGAENKMIPNFIMNLHPDMLKIFLDGYLSGDGSYSDSAWKATSVSKTLIYQLGQCVMKAYGVGYSIFYTKRPEQSVIEGRIVNQKDTWQISFRLEEQKTLSHYIDGSIWMPVKSIEYNGKRQELVYNMEVENDNSYTANNMGVHNCQSFSVAGKRAGLEGESGLIREIFRLLDEHKEEDRPEWLIYENVKGMLSSNRGWDYAAILAEMDRLGYDIQWQNLHTEWYLPQHRERIYTIGHLRERGRAEIFPIMGTDGENSIQLIANRKGYHRNMQTLSPDGITEALDTGQGGGRGHHVGLPCFIDMNYGAGIKTTTESRTIQARYNKGVCGRAAELSSVCVPVLTPDREKKRQNGRRFKEDGEPMFTLTAQDRHGVAMDVIGRLYHQGKTHQGDEIFNPQGEIGCMKATQYKSPPKTLLKVKLDKKEKGIYIEMPGGFLVYCVWYEKYNCYITVRKLTPKECFRLQGWTDDYFEKAAFVNSDSQLYKQAGNGVTVPVVQAVAEKISLHN